MVIDYIKLQAFLNELVGETGYRCNSTVNGTTIHPTTPDAYLSIIRSLKSSNAPFHTYQLAEDKKPYHHKRKHQIALALL